MAARKPVIDRTAEAKAYWKNYHDKLPAVPDGP
jgi:hypothetical protein